MHKNKASLDSFVFQIIKDDLYDIKPDGTILTRVAKTGKIFADRNRWRVAGHLNKVGYRKITYKKKTLSVHRIIYAKYGQLPLTKELVINHIDGDKKNNDINNLELVTTKQNNLHTYRVLKSPPVFGNCVLTYEIASNIRNDSKGGLSYAKISKKYDISKGHISMIINNKIWKK